MEQVLNFLGPLCGGRGYVLILLLSMVKIGLVIGMVMGIVPFVVLYERKLLGWMQDRPGPNRVGPWGLFQGIVDGIKLFIKEEFLPANVDRILFFAAPAMITIAALLALAIIPFGPVIPKEQTLQFYRLIGIKNLSGLPQEIALGISNLNIGVLYAFAITSLGVYGITLAGWSSNNKYSLLGGLRASAQMVSYEITMGLAIAGVLLLAGSLNLFEIVQDQKGGFWNWYVWRQPIGFLLFLIAGFAETNRLPFDLPEAESELTGGYHTEYSSMKFALFFLSEYINMIIFSAMCATLFLGGYSGIVPLEKLGLHPPVWAAYLLGPVVLFLKIGAFLTFFIATRGVLPRLRYDQLMNLGWKVMFPLGLVNLAISAILMGIGAPKLAYFFLGAAIIIGCDQVLRFRRRRQLRKYRYFAAAFDRQGA